MAKYLSILFFTAVYGALAARGTALYQYYFSWNITIAATCVAALAAIGFALGHVYFRTIGLMLGGMIGSQTFPLNACDGSVYVVPVFAAGLGLGLGLCIDASIRQEQLEEAQLQAAGLQELSPSALPGKS